MIDRGRFRSGRPQPLGNQADAPEMSWGNILYRGATALTVLIIVLTVANYFYNIDQNRPLVPFIPLVLAGAIWMIGYLSRYLLTGR